MISGTHSPRDSCRSLQIISGLFFGGGQRVVLDLLGSLPKTGNVDVRFCSLGVRSDSPLACLGADVVVYDGRYNNARVLLSGSRRLAQLIDKIRPDILHTHGLDADLMGGLAVRGRSIRHVSHLHTSPPAAHNTSWKASVRRWLIRGLSKRNRAWFIAVSEAVRQQMAEYYRLPLDRIVTVRNGVDASVYDDCGAESPVNRHSPRNKSLILGTAGRLVPMKGLEYLLQAVAYLTREAVPVELRIAGDGSERVRLEALSSVLNISDCVRFVGHVQDMKAFYREIDVFVLPSLSEGLPLVVLEAMATGRPVVATALAATPEVIEHEVNGLLVPPGDAIAISHAIGRLAADASARVKFSQAARERVLADFTVQHMARGVASVYQRVLTEDRRA